MIRLESFTPADFQQLIDWINSEELLTKWSGTLFSYPLTFESMKWYINDTNVVNETVGHISLGGLSWKNRSARISRVLVGKTSEQRRGICQHMTKAVLKIGFEELGLHRIGLGVYENNPGAIQCYKKCGLKIEGVSKDILWFNNEFLSMVEMAILEDEWKALQV